MFNLSKIIKSWFGGSMEKQASREQLLEEERKSQGLSSAETPEIYESLMNKKEKRTTILQRKVSLIERSQLKLIL